MRGRFDGKFLPPHYILANAKMTNQVAGLPEESPHESANEVIHTEQIETDLAVLRALASETRYTALQFIGAKETEVCVCDIEPALDVSQGAVSQALSKLTKAGLLSRRKDGRWRYYATTEKANAILSVLDKTRGNPNE